MLSVAILGQNDASRNSTCSTEGNEVWAIKQGEGSAPAAAGDIDDSPEAQGKGSAASELLLMQKSGPTGHPTRRWKAVAELLAKRGAAQPAEAKSGREEGFAMQQAERILNGAGINHSPSKLKRTLAALAATSCIGYFENNGASYAAKAQKLQSTAASSNILMQRVTLLQPRKNVVSRQTSDTNLGSLSSWGGAPDSQRSPAATGDALTSSAAADAPAGSPT